MQKTTDENVYKKLYKNKNFWKQSFSVSYPMVLAVKEVTLIIVGGIFRHMADYLSFTLVGVTSSSVLNRYSFAPYFYGSCFGIAMAGILNDTVFRKSQYLVVFVMNLTTILWNIVVAMIPDLDSTRYVPWALFMFGINNSMAEMYLMLLIPMRIADKNRCFAYEMTMTGTLLATVNLMYYVATDFLAQCVQGAIILKWSLSENLCRLIIITLCAISIAIIWRPAKKEFRNLRKRGFRCYCIKKRRKYKIVQVDVD